MRYRARWISPRSARVLARGQLDGALLVESVADRWVLIQPAGVCIADGPALSPDGSRSQGEGDSRSGANEVRHHLGDLAARGSKPSPKVLRRVGPEKVRDLGLRAEVKWTEAGTTTLNSRGRSGCYEVSKARTRPRSAAATGSARLLCPWRTQPPADDPRNGTRQHYWPGGSGVVLESA
jgi:hypothetical protein